MSNTSKLNDTRKTRKGSSNTSKTQKSLSEGCIWTYIRVKNYGQLDFPDALDHLFLLKIKIESAELIQNYSQEGLLNISDNEWRVKVDAFGTDLRSQTFKFGSDLKYNPKRKHGILVRLRSNLDKFSNFLSKSTLRIKVESMHNDEVVYNSEVLIQLSQFAETLNSGVEDKWRRVTREMKLSTPTETDTIPELKLSMLMSLCNDGQCFNMENSLSSPVRSRGSIDAANNTSKKTSATRTTTSTLSTQDVSASDDCKLMSKTLNSSRTKKRRMQKNPRISVGRLTLLSNDLEDKKREIESLKELHENQMSALVAEHQNVCSELEILKSKFHTDENKNIINESLQKTDVAIQTEPDVVTQHDLNTLDKKNIGNTCSGADDTQFRAKEIILDNLIEEYNAKLSSLNLKVGALKIRDTTNFSRFGRTGKNYRETIANKQETKRLIHSKNIFDFIQSEVCVALQLEIQGLEAQMSDFKDVFFRKKLEKEIQNKKELFVTMQIKK